MSKKPQTNRKFEDIFDLANYLNYYFGKNPEAQVTMNDLKKIADNNPGLFAEEPTIVNSASRPVISDNQGHTIMLEMRPAFVVYEDEVEDGDPEEEEPEEHEEDEEENGDSPEDSPEEPEESEEKSESESIVETDSEGREINRDIMEQFDWVKPGEVFLWLDPDTDSEVPVVCDEIRSSTGKVQSDKTDIVVHRRDGDPEERFSIFSDEIVMEDDGDEGDGGAPETPEDSNDDGDAEVEGEEEGDGNDK